jgi:two-component system, OmpR family, KDP operon response regulator KdpE
VTRILVVEDDPALRNAIRSSLTGAGHEIRTAGDGAAGVRELQTHEFEVVLLDIGLPFVDGWQILADMQRGGPRAGLTEHGRQVGLPLSEQSRRVPSVIVISARGEERDKVRALDLGADDYLAKPFGADELLARIRAVLRRAQPPAGPSTRVREGTVIVDLGNHTVTRDGVEVRLSPTEYGLLALLARHAGEVMDHRTLLREVWGPAHSDERNYLRTFIQRLRVKLEDDPRSPQLIVTAGTRGYRFGRPKAS